MLKTEIPGDDSTRTIIDKVFPFRTIISLVAAACLIYFLASQFKLDWGETIRNVRSINLPIYLSAIALYYMSFFFRGLRWRVLAVNASKVKIGNSTGVIEQSDGLIPGLMSCTTLILSAWFVNSITWLRMGDAYRAYTFGSETSRGFSWSLGTILAERVLDMFIIVLLLITALFFLSSALNSTTSRFLLIASVVMALALVLVVLVLISAGGRITSLLPNYLKEALLNLRAGTMGSFTRLPIITMLGASGWVMEIMRVWLVVHSLGINVSISLIVFVAIGNAILSTVPTPGGVGAVEPGITGLLLLGMDSSQAAAVAISDRSITYLSVLVIGGIIFFARQTFYSDKKKIWEKLR